MDICGADNDDWASEQMDIDDVIEMMEEEGMEDEEY